VTSTEAATTRIGAYLEHPLTTRLPRAAVRAPPSSNSSTRAERTSVEHAFPGMSEHALRGTDELRATCLLGGQADDDRGGVGERCVGSAPVRRIALQRVGREGFKHCACRVRAFAGDGECGLSVWLAFLFLTVQAPRDLERAAQAREC
jgi:hypothetical protein